MSMYNTGSVQVKAGSALVKGDTGSENFVLYTSVGYLFRLASESVWYQIAGIPNATNLTLSSRYTNTDHEILTSDEWLATVNTATRMYSGTINTPVIQNTVSINASIETFTDDGAGVLTGDASPAGSGTIGYDDGAWSITLGTDLTASADMSVSYYYGNTLNSMSYQICTDYTPYHTIPEMSLNDVNFPTIYTEGVRRIDERLYNGSFNDVYVDKFVKINNSNYIFSGDKTTLASIVAEATNLSGTSVLQGGLYLGNTGLWRFDSDTTATKIDENFANVNAVNYIQIGTNKYILSGNKNFSASIVAEATFLGLSSLKGSLYMGDGVTWVFDSDTTATTLD